MECIFALTCEECIAAIVSKFLGQFDDIRKISADLEYKRLHWSEDVSFEDSFAELLISYYPHRAREIKRLNFSGLLMLSHLAFSNALDKYVQDVMKTDKFSCVIYAEKMFQKAIKNGMNREQVGAALRENLNLGLKKKSVLGN